jgi:1,2-phenylacetyl-CoA epoxidase PaaB subunit
MVTGQAGDHYGRLAAYEVFARHGKDPALYHLGQVRATDLDDAEMYAYTMYDERRWEEMFLVKKEHIIEVIPPD